MKHSITNTVEVEKRMPVHVWEVGDTNCVGSRYYMPVVVVR